MAMNFWSREIRVVKAKSPVAVLSEATSQLAVITQGLVEANVRSSSTKTGFLIHRIWIEAPTLGYEKKVAKFVHEPTPYYPVWATRLKIAPRSYREVSTNDEEDIGSDTQSTSSSILSSLSAPNTAQTPPGTALDGEEALTEWLKTFLSSDKIVGLVNGLIATANSADTSLIEDEQD